MCRCFSRPSLRIVRSCGREGKRAGGVGDAGRAGAWRLRIRQATEGRRRSARGQPLPSFSAHQPTTACRSHLLTCRGQERPKTLLVAEQREKKTFIIKTERRLTRQSRQVHNTTRTVPDGPAAIHVPRLQAFSCENSRWLGRGWGTNTVGHEDGAKQMTRDDLATLLGSVSFHVTGLTSFI